MMRRVSDLGDSWSDSWKTPRWPSSPRSPRTPSQTADHPRAARWSDRNAEIKQANEAPRRRTSDGNPLKGDKTTDCIYTITIDGIVAYVGQTNDFQKRKTKHKKRLFVEMMAKNPGSVVEMQIVPHKHPDVLTPNKGPQLDAMEKYYMEKVYDTLAIKGDDKVGEGVNKYRWNKNRAPSTISDAHDARTTHLLRCDGPSSEPCDGNERPWTPKSIKRRQESIATMIESVEPTRDDEESRDLARGWHLGAVMLFRW
jgi:hypothetical protein